MSIVLLGSTSGSCTLQEQAVAGTTVLTLPTTSGTVLTSASSVARSQLPTGSILQTVQFWTEATTQYSGTNNFTTIDVSASITPISSSSRVLVTYSVTLGSQSNVPILTRLLRNGSAIGASTQSGGSRNLGNSVVANGGNYSPQHVTGTGTYSYLDSPSTTSALTYAVQVRTRNDETNRVRLNAADDLNTNPFQLLGTSTITLFEIAG
jgi:hypothetical protein